MNIEDRSGYRMKIDRSELYMDARLWGEGATLPNVPDDGQVIVSDHGPDAPPGQRYSVLGFDPDTTERYWRTRPKGERNRLAKNAAKIARGESDNPIGS